MGVLSKQAYQIYIVILFAHASYQNIVLLRRTKNKNFIPFVLLYFTMVVANFVALFFNEFKLLIPFAIIVIPLTFCVLYILVTKKISYRHGQVFELAAKPVEENADGFTPRPYPVGDAEFSRNEIIQFAKFVTKNLIAMGYVEDDRVYLVIVINEWAYSRIRKPKFEAQSYVSFDYSGNVAVNITKKDYNKFKY